MTKANEPAVPEDAPAQKQNKTNTTDEGDGSVAVAVAQANLSENQGTERVPLDTDAFVCLKNRWYVKISRNPATYVLADLGVVKSRLRISGMSDARESSTFDRVEFEAEEFRKNNSVSYAGPVAGWPSGIHTVGAFGGMKKVLVTSGAMLMPGAPGDCETLKDVIRGMLGDEQFHIFCLWLHVARIRLKTRRWHALHALGLVGPAGAGKSFLQNMVITPMLGGRASRPGPYMRGQTDFNSEMFGAEHLAIEDETEFTDAQSRKAIGGKIKNLLFTHEQRCHGKGVDAVDLYPFWAMTISLNGDPEHLRSLPAMDDSLRDKITMLVCQKTPRPVPDGVIESDWLRALVESQGPAFAAVIDGLNLADVQANLKDERTRVAAWQNPAFLRELVLASPAGDLIAAIDHVYFSSPAAGPWVELSTAKILSDLRENQLPAALHWAAPKSATSLGMSLSRIARDYPTRFIKTRDMTERKWKIMAPEPDGDDGEGSPLT